MYELAGFRTKVGQIILNLLLLLLLVALGLKVVEVALKCFVFNWPC